MLTPALTKLRGSVAVLVFPFVLGLAFYASSSLAHRAGTAWSPKPDWQRPTRLIIRDVPTMRLAPTQTGPLATGCNAATPSGLGYAWLVRGGKSAVHPGPHDNVDVRYGGWDLNGHVLPGMPNGGRARFRVDQLIPGWVEGLQMMTENDRIRLCVPESLAYNGRADAPAGMLVFEIELLAINRPRD